MDPESKNLLRELLEISKENNEILHKQWRATQVGRLFKFMYWFVIISLSLGAYYFIQPFLEAITGGYSDINTGVNAGIDTGLNGIEGIKGLLGL